MVRAQAPVFNADAFADIEVRTRADRSWLTLPRCTSALSRSVRRCRGPSLIAQFDSILGGAEEVLNDLGVRQAMRKMPPAVL